MLIKGMEQLAAMFGVAPKTIVEWQEQGLPIAKRGQRGVPSEYIAAECIAWYLDRELAKVRTESPNDRLARVKADAVEMDNAERRKLLIPADQLEPKLRAAFVVARERWVEEPGRLARDMEGLDMAGREALMQEAFERLLHRMADWRNADAALDEEGDA